MCTFISDSPRGPFKPDHDAFWLSGSTMRDFSWLAKTFHWKGEILSSNWYTPADDTSFKDFIPGCGKSLYVGPLKKLTVDTMGHLRLVWWNGNEVAKGGSYSLDSERCAFVHPAERHRGGKFSCSVSADGATLLAGPDGALAVLPASFDFAHGVIIEGVLRASESSAQIRSHWHPAAAGFYFEQAPGKGMLIQLETLGLSRTGVFEYSPEPTFDTYEYIKAAAGIVDRGGGPYLGLSRFSQEDVIGPLGYAVPCGILNGTAHQFRLLVKHGIWELYLDDLYVQTYITGSTSGRLGLFAKSGSVEFANLRCWTMTSDLKKK